MFNVRKYIIQNILRVNEFEVKQTRADLPDFITMKKFVLVAPGVLNSLQPIGDIGKNTYVDVHIKSEPISTAHGKLLAEIQVSGCIKQQDAFGILNSIYSALSGIRRQKDGKQKGDK